MFLVCLFYREQTNQNVVQIKIGNKTYNYITNNALDADEFNLIDIFIIATVKMQNDHTQHIQFSTVISAHKKKENI